jgi:FkbM family methyltransferase
MFSKSIIGAKPRLKTVLFTANSGHVELTRSHTMKLPKDNLNSTGAAQTRNKSAKVRRAISIIRTEGLIYYSQNYIKKRFSNQFISKMQNSKIDDDTWREINFRALNLHRSAKLLLNPSDLGFSREFNAYGFREPLNTFAFFCQVAKKKPVVLDVGGNLGYFPLVELQAGAKKVVAVEPVPSTFKLLAKTLEGYKEKAEVLNLAISDSDEPLKLYVGTKHNVTSSFKQVLVGTGHKLAYEINAETNTLQSMAETYQVDMVRMDVEGHEYRILSERVPDQIDSLCIELHVLPPFSKIQAIRLLQSLKSQNFHAHVAINEMSYEYYELIQMLGLKNAYKWSTTFGSTSIIRPSIQVEPSFDDVVKMIPERGQIHLLLER